MRPGAAPKNGFIARRPAPNGRRSLAPQIHAKDFCRLPRIDCKTEETAKTGLSAGRSMTELSRVYGVRVRVRTRTIHRTKKPPTWSPFIRRHGPSFLHSLDRQKGPSFLSHFPFSIFLTSHMDRVDEPVSWPPSGKSRINTPARLSSLGLADRSNRHQPDYGVPLYLSFIPLFARMAPPVFRKLSGRAKDTRG